VSDVNSGGDVFWGTPDPADGKSGRQSAIPCKAPTGAHRALASDVLASNPLTMSFVLAGLAAVQAVAAALLTARPEVVSPFPQGTKRP
jgi:hypothetical protein